MNIAILLRGHIQRTKAMNASFNYEFIYNKTIESFNENILKFIEKYDIYASVKCENEIERNNIYNNFINDYHISNSILNDNTTTQYDDILTGLKLVYESNNKYDIIIVTRVDFLYKISFDKLEYDKDKFNFCWSEPIGNNNQWICDNFYIISFKYLENIIKIYEKNKDKFAERYFGQCILSQSIIKELEYNFIFKNKYYSGTNWNNGYCNNPLYIIYGYNYAFSKIY